MAANPTGYAWAQTPVPSRNRHHWQFLFLLWTLSFCCQEGNSWTWTSIWRNRRKQIATIVDPWNRPQQQQNDDDAAGNNNGTQHLPTNVDSYFMNMALSEAQKAMQRGEVPIGAVVVRPIVGNINDRSHSQRLDKQPDNDDNDSAITQKRIQQSPPRHAESFQILGRASNRVEQDCDASAHAELLAMRHAARYNNGATNWRLINATLYTTVEPCPMCLAAAQAFRIGRIVYGAPDLRIGAIDTYLQLLDVPHPIHTIQNVTRGVYEQQSAELLRSFFQRQRQTQKQRRRRRRQQQRNVHSGVDDEGNKTAAIRWKGFRKMWSGFINKPTY